MTSRPPPGRRFARRHSSSATVLLADDDAATRAGVRLALAGCGFEIVAEAANARDAVAKAREHAPDLCLIDVSLEGGGIVAAREIHVALPKTRIVMLTVSPDERDVFESLLAGATGYLLKEGAAERLPQALRDVLAGRAALPRQMELRLIEEVRAHEVDRPSAGRVAVRGGGSVRLTRRERQVLDLMREHMSTTEVAQRLSISEVTVRRHMSAIMRKLDVSGRAGVLERPRPDEPS